MHRLSLSRTENRKHSAHRHGDLPQFVLPFLPCVCVVRLSSSSSHLLASIHPLHILTPSLHFPRGRLFCVRVWSHSPRFCMKVKRSSRNSFRFSSSSSSYSWNGQKEFFFTLQLGCWPLTLATHCRAARRRFSPWLGLCCTRCCWLCFDCFWVGVQRKVLPPGSD